MIIAASAFPLRPLPLLRHHLPRLVRSTSSFRPRPPSSPAAAALLRCLKLENFDLFGSSYPHFDQQAAVRDLEIAITRQEREEDALGDLVAKEVERVVERVVATALEVSREASKREADENKRESKREFDEMKEGLNRDFEERMGVMGRQFAELADVTLAPRIAVSSYLLQFTVVNMHPFRLHQMSKHYDSRKIPSHLQDRQTVPFPLLDVHAYQAFLRAKGHRAPICPLFFDAAPKEATTYFAGPVETQDLEWQEHLATTRDIVSRLGTP